MTIDTIESQNVEVSMSQPDRGTTAESLTGGSEAGLHQSPEVGGSDIHYLYNVQTPSGSPSQIIPMNDTAIPISARQARRPVIESSLLRGMATLKQYVASIPPPQHRRHRKTQSDHILQSPHTWNIANASSTRRSLTNVERNPRSEIERSAGPTDNQLKATLLSFRDVPKNTGFRLVDMLTDVYAQEALTDQNFIPNGQLDEVVTQASVDHELSRFEHLPTYLRHGLWRKTRPQIVIPSSPHAISSSAAKSASRRNYQKIFAILVLMRRPEKILRFVKEKVHDGDLPLCLDATKDSLRRKTDLHTALRCLKTRSDVRDFVERQWCVLAPSFNPSEAVQFPRLVISKREILPFVFWDNKGHSGGSGSVHQVKIHPNHHSFDETLVPNNVVAVKEISNSDKESFEREYNVLRHLCNRNKNTPHHLVTLLAAYEKNDKFYLLLPWAEVDLDRYWREKFPDAPCPSPEVSSWIRTQCCGLTEAVSYIHRYHTTSATSILRAEYSPQLGSTHAPVKKVELLGSRRGELTLSGRHGDIKPANILWYPDPWDKRGILRLADFGTARFSKVDRISNGKTIPSSRPYRSPESILSEDNLSSQCDIWALGCVFLEFVCWYAGGRDRLEAFEKARARGYESPSFCYCIHEGMDNRTDAPLRMAIKRSVTEMIDNLQQQVKMEINVDMISLMKIIQDEMLVVSRGRKSSGTILRNLGS